MLYGSTQKPILIGIARIIIVSCNDLYSQLIASDAAGNDSLTRTATVIVNLRDKNDNFPIFSDSVYDVLVGEEVQPGAVIANVSVSKKTACSSFIHLLKILDVALFRQNSMLNQRIHDLSIVMESDVFTVREFTLK